MAKKLLLADDSITIQKVVGITFAQEDFELIYSDNGLDALNKVRQTHPDIILADTVMPQKNGYELCELLKKDPALANIPVLLLTGSFETFDENRGKKAGADGFMIKPFDSQALIDKVNELVSKAAARPAAKPAAAPAAQPPAPAAATPPPAAAVPKAAPPPAPEATPPPAAPEPLLAEAPFSPDFLTADSSTAAPAAPGVFAAPETGNLDFGLSAEEVNLAPFAPDSFASEPAAAEEKAPALENLAPAPAPASTAAPSGGDMKVDFGLEFPEGEIPVLEAPAAAAPTAPQDEGLWPGEGMELPGEPAVPDLALDLNAAPPAAEAAVQTPVAPDLGLDLSMPTAEPGVDLAAAATDEPSFEIGFPEPTAPEPKDLVLDDSPPAAPAEPAPWLEPAAAAAQIQPPAQAPAALAAAPAQLSPDEMKRLVEEQVRGVIEQIVWEVVPALAEQVIKSELARLLEEEKKS